MARNQGKVGSDKSDVIERIPAACADEAKAVAFMEAERWGDCPCCPHCGSVAVYTIKNRKSDEREKNYRWRCRDCGKLYSVRTGTIMEESRIPLRHWCYAFWRSCTSKKGVSALEIKRQTGLSYKSSLFMMHRIRFAMAPTGDGPKLTGIVEADETYVGGKPRHRVPLRYSRTGKQVSNYKTRTTRKTMVFAALQRGGQVRVRVVPNITTANLREAVKAHIDLSARLITDEHKGYVAIGRSMKGGHEAVNHGAYEYVRGDVTTNRVEGFFAILKRGIHGIYHNVSKRHLQRYLDEFEFRHNHRHLEDGQRVTAAIRGGDGKRLTYQMPA